MTPDDRASARAKLEYLCDLAETTGTPPVLMIMFSLADVLALWVEIDRLEMEIKVLRKQ